MSTGAKNTIPSLSASVAAWEYVIHLADNSLILGQRNAEWCGHGPVLEQDIAITNISLDLIGQARNFYSHAASVYNNFSDSEKEAAKSLIPRLWSSYGRQLEEDDLAFLRDEHQYLNLLITELPKGDWAQTILRQFLFSAYHQLLFEGLVNSKDEFLRQVAEKSIKEVNYHLRWSAEWVIRLGDGTPESRSRIEKALSELWMFTGEMFDGSTDFEKTSVQQGIAIDTSALRSAWQNKVNEVFNEAGLSVPAETKWFQSGGKKGQHTEYLGYLLSEMQYLQKTYPNATW